MVTRRGLPRSRRDRRRRVGNQGADIQALFAAAHDPLARIEPGHDLHAVLALQARGDLPTLDAVGGDNPHAGAVAATRDGLARHGQGVSLLARDELHLDVLPREEPPLGVRTTASTTAVRARDPQTERWSSPWP